MKLYQFILFIVIAIIAVSFLESLTKEKKVITFSNGIEIKVEVADNDKEREKGLMKRNRLGDKKGMLFIFSDDQVRSFWMKDTLIPLDMIFLDKDKNIVHIIKGVQPCFTETCFSYSSVFSSRYVIEVNSGFSDKYGITKETEVEFQ